MIADAMRLAALLACVFVHGCIFVPRTTTAYDEECKIETKRMTLRPEQVGALGSCGGRECVAALAAFGVIAAASAVVSGSIVVVGNVVYWIEKQGKCALA